jgi:predicted transposase YbfD/YdcC
LTHNETITKRHIKRIAALKKPVSRHIETEKTRNRFTTRTVEVFDDLTLIDSHWTGIKSLIGVERVGTRTGKAYRQVVCYISSIVGTAKEFPHGIRGHWGIENRLHWGGSAVGGFPDLRRLPFQDVVLNEDNSTISMAKAPANLSIMRASALNILRRNGSVSITIAQRFLSHKIDKILALGE